MSQEFLLTSHLALTFACFVVSGVWWALERYGWMTVCLAAALINLWGVVIRAQLLAGG